MLELTDRFLVGPDAAADNLVRNHRVNRDRIGQVAYFVPPGGPAPPDPTAVRSELGIDDSSILVGACGVRDWRKAPDHFAHLAWEVHRRAPELDVRFVWVGSGRPGPRHWDQEADLVLLGLGDRLRFVEDQPDPDPWLAAFDVYALTSREDNFPLACLTACSFGVPAVAFAGGGIPDLLRASDGGRVVAYPEVGALAATVIELAGDAGTRRRLGDNVAAHVARHHQLDGCARQVADEIRALVGT